MGDPVFNSWVLMWTGGQVLAALGGDFNALHQYWHGNIFAPEPLTITYSEHLTPQMLQALPIWATTGNIVLAYNLLFLSTFVLSGVGHVSVRARAHRPPDGRVRGRAWRSRSRRTGSRSTRTCRCSRATGCRSCCSACGGTSSPRPRRSRSPAPPRRSSLQNLSCGYYMLFFAPFAGLYAIYEIAHRRLWRDCADVALARASRRSR